MKSGTRLLMGCQRHQMFIEKEMGRGSTPTGVECQCKLIFYKHVNPLGLLNTQKMK